MNIMKSLFTFLAEIIKSRRIIFELTKSDFKRRYLGSYLGILWAYIQPITTILIFWFVFQIGFKTMPVYNFPFILWLMSGIVPWFFFSESLASATNSIIENSYLVNKMVFKVSILPIIKIFSALVVHLFFVVFMFFMFGYYGYYPNIYNLQVFYYLFATIILVLGISWITSSLIIFMRDIGQLVGMILQFAFWLTPVFWSFNIIPKQFQLYMKLNPLFYIVEGYRETFIYHKWFWENPWLTFYFWSITFILVVIGAVLFRKLRPHFADVL